MDTLDIFRNGMSAFIQSIGGPEEHKVAEQAGLYIAERLRERGIARQIITPRPVTRADLRNSKEHDQLVFIDEKEVRIGKAMPLNFKAEPDGRYIEVERYEIPIQEVASEDYKKKEIELLASTQPVTKIIEENLVKEIEAQEDHTWFTYTRTAADAAGNGLEVKQGSTVGARMTKTSLKLLINLIESKQLRCATFVMHVLQWNDLLDAEYETLGSDLLKMITVEGYMYGTLLGRKVIVSIKQDNTTQTFFKHPSLKLNDGTTACPVIYGYADEKALGRFLQLEQLKFGVAKKFSTIEMRCWEYVGMAVGNINGCAYIALSDKT
jgi:hypothetical protein